MKSFQKHSFSKMNTIQFACILVLSTIAGSFAAGNDSDLPLHPDTGLNIVQFLEKYGYPLESHEVTTEDGYILTMHRIPHGRNEIPDPKETKPAVLLVHGVLSSSMDWVNMGPGKSLGLMLADEGYDVWLGNVRGNTWSRKHTTLDPDGNDTTFWSYSFHEIGIYDLPAKIDYILNETDLKKISYVGHSKGTTSFMVLASTKPEYNDKINVMAALAPVAYMEHAPGPLLQLAKENQLLVEVALGILGWKEILPQSEAFTELSNVLCNDNSDLQQMCVDIIFLLVGVDSPQLNRTFITVITSNFPAGVAVQELKHYLQEINTEFFRQYDWGLLGNIAKYGQSSPPSYDTMNITAPVGLYYSENDFFTSVVDVERLSNELPNLVKKYLVPWSEFNHLDFIWAIDVDTLVNNDVVDLLNKYKNTS